MNKINCIQIGAAKWVGERNRERASNEDSENSFGEARERLTCRAENVTMTISAKLRHIRRMWNAHFRDMLHVLLSVSLIPPRLHAPRLLRRFLCPRTHPKLLKRAVHTKCSLGLRTPLPCLLFFSLLCILCMRFLWHENEIMWRHLQLYFTDDIHLKV